MVSRDMGGAELERLIAEETEVSEQTRDEPLSGRAARKRPTRSVVYSIRLTPEQTEEIQRIAEAAGIPAGGVVAGWGLRGPAARRGGVGGAAGAGGRAGGVSGADGGSAVARRGPAAPPAHRAASIVTGHLCRRNGKPNGRKWHALRHQTALPGEARSPCVAPPEAPGSHGAD